MSKIVFSLAFILFVLPFAVFGQSYEGFYRAHFISLDRNVNPTAEFEIQSNGNVSGKIIVNGSSTIIRGKVDFSGMLEAVSGNESSTKFTLKTDLKQNGKITLMSRSQTNTAGSQSNSGMFMQGTYSKIEKSTNSNWLLPYAGKSELTIEQPNPLFESKFSSTDAKVILEKNGSFNLYHLQMMGGTENTERGFYFSIARPQDSPQKIWKAENIRALNYVEKTEKYTKVNRFRTDYEKWLKNKDVASGEIELVSEDSRRMVFRINNLKIKNEANNDFVTINGTVYAEISKY